MVIVSVDLGDSRTGIAVCDKLEMLASPVTVIHERYIPNVIAEVCRIVRETTAELIVVGYPKNMNGIVGERAKKCAAFAADLSEACGVKAVLWDERLTTVAAHRVLDEAELHYKKKAEVVDKLAAVLILQGYLDYLSMQSQNHETKETEQ